MGPATTSISSVAISLSYSYSSNYIDTLYSATPLTTLPTPGTLLVSQVKLNLKFNNILLGWRLA